MKLNLQRLLSVFAVISTSFSIISCNSTKVCGIPAVDDGWIIYKAGNYRYGPCFINNADGSIDAWFAATGDFHGKDKTIRNIPSDHNCPYPVINGDAGQYFKIDKDFYSLQLWCPTWNSNVESMEVSIYNWMGDYDSTVKEEPVRIKIFENIKNDEWIRLEKNEEAENDHSILFPAGEYLWVARNATEHAGIWAYDGAAEPAGKLSPVSFIGGERRDNFQFDSRIAVEYTTAEYFWDQISYQHSEDGGKTWTPEVFTLLPTENTMDSYSCCDPGVARWGGYYYLGYTSSEDPRGMDNNVFVARSKNPDGPWEKWNGNGWGGDPKPVIQYHGIGDPDQFGAGEPCFVILDGTVYFYYSWNENGVKTRVSTVSAEDPDWPAHLEYKGVAIDKSEKAFKKDHSDVKYRPDQKKFYAINTAERMTENAYIEVWSSEDGLRFKLEGKLTGKEMKAGLHNCGWSGDEKGIQDPSKPQYIGYAFGLNEWGVWDTWFAPLKFPVQ